MNTNTADDSCIDFLKAIGKIDDCTTQVLHLILLVVCIVCLPIIFVYADAKRKKAIDPAAVNCYCRAQVLIIDMIVFNSSLGIFFIFC